MSKPRQTLEAARVMVTPLFAWSNAVLKSGEMMLDSMAAAAKGAREIRVAVLPDVNGSRPARKASGTRKKRMRARRRR